VPPHTFLASYGFTGVWYTQTTRDTGPIEAMDRRVWFVRFSWILFYRGAFAGLALAAAANLVDQGPGAAAGGERAEP
jgi:hypothetical protein